jgi:alpha-L-rhamnosidase
MTYDSGEVFSKESAHIQIPEIHLESLTRYYVRVKVKACGEYSSWRETSFLTALCGPQEWKAEFITAEAEEDGNRSYGTYVRGTFCVDKKVKEAYLCSTALGLYQCYLNGQRIGEDEMTPGWTSYHKHLCYQTYEVTSLLQSGDNAMGAMLGAGWYKGTMGFVGKRNHYGKHAAFAAQLLIRYEDGSEAQIVTDEGWIGADSPVVFAEIYDGEIYDASREIKGWAEAGTPDGNWGPIRKVPFDTRVLTAQGAGTVKKIEEVKPQRLFCTPAGDTVLDFGQNMTGRIEVRATGKAGDVIEIACFEALDADGNVYIENLRGAKETMKYIFGEDGTITYRPSFTFMGFQYAKIVSFPGEPKLEQFTAYTLHSDMKRTGRIETSNPLVNQLTHNILWGLKGNFLDVPTDCPQRDERLGWTGDAQIFCRTACFLMNTYTFYQKWLTDVRLDQRPDGGVPHVIPDILGQKPEEQTELSVNAEDLQKDEEEQDWGEAHSAAAWADVSVINPWTMYLNFGDKKILEQQYDSMKAWIGFMREHAVDYIWNYRMQFGDWVALDAEEGSYLGATPNDLTCTAFFAYSTSLFVKAARVLGKEEDVKEYSDLYSHIVEKFQNTFFDEDGVMTAQTQTAHIVALYFGLVPQKFRQKTVEGLKKLLDRENGHLVTGFVGTPYFCHALSQNGCVKEAYDLLLKEDFPSWLYQVKMGATTIWEHWDGRREDGSMWSPDMNSFNHYAYGAIGEWLVRVAGGLEIDEADPGYHHALIAPKLGGDFRFFKVSYESIYGTVASGWSVDDDEVTISVQIPVNTTATLSLDQAEQVIEADELSFKEDAFGVLQAEAGSGTYVIRYKRKAE